MNAEWPRVCIVGPLPPPSGGMANQCEQLVRLLRLEGAEVELVRNNAPYRPHWVGRLPVLRAFFRLVPYLTHVWRATSRAQVVHLLANSGWAWHLFATPVLVVGRLRGTPVIVNYRGGNADEFLAQAPRHVLHLLSGAALRVTPSGFLERVLRRYGLDAVVVPNFIDLSRFTAGSVREPITAPQLLVARNLEAIYDIPTALRAFATVCKHYPAARLTVAGSGPELVRLQALAFSLGLAEAVDFPGRTDTADMPKLYARADCAINPSTVDNMPNSILEAFASGVPIVSTRAGGVPDIVTHKVNGLLVPVGDAEAMAAEVLRVLSDRDLARGLREAGLQEARRYAWPSVREQWRDVYRRTVSTAGTE